MLFFAFVIFLLALFSALAESVPDAIFSNRSFISLSLSSIRLFIFVMNISMNAIEPGVNSRPVKSIYLTGFAAQNVYGDRCVNLCAISSGVYHRSAGGKCRRAP